LYDKENNLLPANWLKDTPTIVQNPKTFSELENRNKELEENKNGFSWYLSFRNKKSNW